MTEVAERYRKILARVEDGVSLIAVSKGVSAQKMQAAYDAGARDFGESYVEEWSKKVDILPDDVRWHFIGPLQSRTFKEYATLFDERAYRVHVVDREKLARALSERTTRQIDVLIQVNIGAETQKSGVAVGDLEQLLNRTRALSGIVVRGLMVLPPFLDPPEAVEPYFEETQKLFTTHCVGFEDFNEVSMGMSQDFGIAMRYGATWVRVGSAIFGART